MHVGLIIPQAGFDSQSRDIKKEATLVAFFVIWHNVVMNEVSVIGDAELNKGIRFGDIDWNTSKALLC